MNLRPRSRQPPEPEVDVPGKSRTRKLIQGTVVFLVMFALLWTFLSRYDRDRN